MMVTAVPLLSASPTSTLQEVPSPFPAAITNPAAEQRIEMEAAAPISFGIASWYSQSDPFINERTANGEIFDDTKMTCASWHFPFRTRLKITNLTNGKSVICTVNDRGPAKRLGRIVDLTRAAFRKIADLNAGLAEVSVVPIDY